MYVCVYLCNVGYWLYTVVIRRTFTIIYIFFQASATLSRKNVWKKGAYYMPESDQSHKIEIEKKKKVVPR